MRLGDRLHSGRAGRPRPPRDLARLPRASIGSIPHRSRLQRRRPTVPAPTGLHRTVTIRSPLVNASGGDRRSVQFLYLAGGPTLVASLMIEDGYPLLAPEKSEVGEELAAHFKVACCAVKSVGGRDRPRRPGAPMDVDVHPARYPPLGTTGRALLGIVLVRRSDFDAEGAFPGHFRLFHEGVRSLVASMGPWLDRLVRG